MGSRTATIVAVVIASLEEATTRGFLVEFDRTIRRMKGEAKLKEGTGALKLQRLVWMCDANQSAIAEITAIVVSSFAQVLLEPHSTVVGLGYDHNPSIPLSVAFVFVQLMVELVLELVVDNGQCPAVHFPVYFHVLVD